jgi:hypothetical protein
MIHQKARIGATLTEVLVAIFVMAIGLLALLTLFPLGALSMAQAIKDNRTAHSGRNAFAIAEAMNIHNDALVANNGIAGGGTGQTYFLNPYPTIPQLPPPPQAGNPPQYLAPDLYTISNSPLWLVPALTAGLPGIVPYDGPSYPVYVDPAGCGNFRTLGLAVGLPYPTVGNVPPPIAPGNGISSIPRQPLGALLSAASPPITSISDPRAITSAQSLVRWCTLSDDITFNEDGTPSTSTGNVQRENRYSWAWLLRRPKANDSTVVDVTVVVYSGRSLTSLGETAYISGLNPNTGNATNFVWFDPNSKFVDITYSGTKPSIRTGSWILDATMEYYNSTAQLNIPDPHGFFYRVVGVTDVSNNVMRLELQTNPKKRSFYNTSDTGAYGVLIVMENVAEVFEKGPGWQP